MKFHAYAIGALDKQHGLDGLGQALIFFALTIFVLVHTFVSSIAVLLMRNVRRGVLYAHGATLAIEIAAVTMVTALG